MGDVDQQAVALDVDNDVHGVEDFEGIGDENNISFMNPIGEIYDGFDMDHPEEFDGFYDNFEGELEDQDEIDDEDVKKIYDFRAFCQANLNDTQIKQLLKHISAIKNIDNFPTTFDEFMDTPPATEMPSATEIEGGEYMHLGIQKNLLFFPRELLVADEIVVKISFDGVRLHKNSKVTMWPTMIVEHIKGETIMLIRVFFGHSKPLNSNEYFYCLIKELIEIYEAGARVTLKNGQTVNLTIHSFIADTPARTMAMGKEPTNSLF